MKLYKKFAAAAVTAAIMLGQAGAGTVCVSTVYAEEKLSGWQTVDGKEYYYKNGKPVTKSATIGGVRYKFDKDGVCQGKYTGWVKSGGNNFYIEDGVKVYGWVHAGEMNKDGRWYYIDKKNGRLTGKQTIDGLEYSFSDKGVWDGIAAESANGKTRYSVAGYANSGKLNKKAYGGVYLCDSMLIILSVDGKAEKLIEKKFPGVGGIVYREAEFSMYEISRAAEEIKAQKGIWSSISSDEINNRLIVGTESKEQREKLLAFLETLPNKEFIVLVEDSGEYIEDAEASVFGVTMEVKDVAPTGLTVVLIQGEGGRTGETITGDEYFIERKNGKKWEPVEYIIDDFGWNALAYLISECDGGRTELKHNWEWLYGSLPAGDYRIVKEIFDTRGSGDYDKKLLYAEFSIS